MNMRRVLLAVFVCLVAGKVRAEVASDLFSAPKAVFDGSAVMANPAMVPIKTADSKISASPLIEIPAEPIPAAQTIAAPALRNPSIIEPESTGFTWGLIGGVIGGGLGFFLGGPVGALAGLALGAILGAVIGFNYVSINYSRLNPVGRPYKP